MPLFVISLVLATAISGAWCLGASLSTRIRTRSVSWARAALNATGLAAVLILAAALRFHLIPPHHAMYLDEPWYAEAACNLARRGQLVLCQATWGGEDCAAYEKAPGWPVLIAPWTVLFGCDTSIGIALSRAIGSLSVALVAVTALAAGATWWPSLFAATIAAIYPVHVTWSATGETNVAAAAIVLAALYGSVVYIRSGRCCGGFLAASAFGLATAVRPESVAPALVSALVIVLAARVNLRQRLLTASAIALVCAASAATGFLLWTMNESISGGAFLSFVNIARHALVLVRSGSLRVDGVVIVIALVGAYRLGKAHFDVVSLLLGSAVAAGLVVLAYDRFHERMMLVATLAVLPLAAFAVEQPSTIPSQRAYRRALVGAAMLVAIAVLWRRDLVAASVPSETQVLETRIASRIAQTSFVPGALFIAAQPTVLRAGGIADVMEARHALDHEERVIEAVNSGRPVYFLCDMYCEEGFESSADAPCREMLTRFGLSPVVEESLHSRTYALYRVSGLARGTVPPRECPRRSTAEQ